MWRLTESTDTERTAKKEGRSLYPHKRQKNTPPLYKTKLSQVKMIQALVKRPAGHCSYNTQGQTLSLLHTIQKNNVHSIWENGLILRIRTDAHHKVNSVVDDLPKNVQCTICFEDPPLLQQRCYQLVFMCRITYDMKKGRVCAMSRKSAHEAENAARTRATIIFRLSCSCTKYQPLSISS